MAGTQWALDDIPWHRLEPAGVGDGVLAVIKAAALVEGNAEAYGAYLHRVFAGDTVFQDAAREWALEEVRHGVALGRWASLVDPAFDFAAAIRDFRNGYRLPIALETASVRGSRSGELAARCMVEIGTSSFYSAVAEATGDPVLRILCRHIAADEFRHYKLFLEHQKRYLAVERIGRGRRLWIGLGRVLEVQDDELAYAYHAANVAGAAYDRRCAAGAYERRALRCYRRHHVERMVGMAAKACGFSPRSRWLRPVERLVWWLMGRRLRRLERKGA